LPALTTLPALPAVAAFTGTLAAAPAAPALATRIPVGRLTAFSSGAIRSGPAVSQTGFTATFAVTRTGTRTIRRIRTAGTVKAAIGSTLSVSRIPAGTAAAFAAFAIDTGKREPHEIHLAAAEARAIADRGIADRLHVPLVPARFFAIGQGSEKIREILVPVAHIPAFIARPESAHVDAGILLPKIVGRQIPQIFDRRDRKNHRHGAHQRRQGEEQPYRKK
jgi:hypothetical protein